MATHLNTKLSTLANLIPVGPAVTHPTTGAEIVPALYARDAKLRFLMYRCRMVVRTLMPSSFTEEPMLDLEIVQQQVPNLIRDLGTLATSLRAALPAVEAAFAQAVTHNPSRLDIGPASGDITAGDYAPETYRYCVMWDIVWGLAATDPGLLVDGQGVRRTSPVPDWFFELVERRLRTVERVRYNTGNPNANAPSSLMFLYPPLSGPCYVGGLTATVPGVSSSEWTEFASCDYQLDAGVADPTVAIENVFKDLPTTDVNRWASVKKTANRCDHVLHLIHLEALVDSLRRTSRRSDLTPYTDRIGVVTGWHRRTYIGGGNPDDPFFIREPLRTDEIIPGDHIRIMNHPLYRAFFGENEVWQLENCVVGRIAGTAVPNDLEVQGHGMGPQFFRQLQAQLITQVQTAVLTAQNELEDPAAPALHAAQLEAGADRRYIHAFSFGSMAAPIEFRNEFADRGLGAFAVRWLSVPLRQGLPARMLTDFELTRYFGPHRDIGHRNPRVSDRDFYYGSWGFPWIRNLRVNVPERYALLEGENLTSHVVRGAYFVALPRYYLDTTIPDPTSPLLAHLGNWGGTQPFIPAALMTFAPDGSWARVSIPPTFVEGEQFWTPVLRVSLFNTRVEEIGRLLDASTNYASQPIEWFENDLHDADDREAVVKDAVASLQFEVRSPMAFHWPAIGSPWLEFVGASHVNLPGEAIEVEIEGHDYFNEVFFPLYRLHSSGAYTRVQLKTETITDLKSDPLTAELGRFYNAYAAHGVIDVIRPRDPAALNP